MYTCITFVCKKSIKYKKNCGTGIHKHQKMVGNISQYYAVLYIFYNIQYSSTLYIVQPANTCKHSTQTFLIKIQ